MVVGGFRSYEAIEKALGDGVFLETAALNRVSKKAGFIVWLKKKSGKRRPENPNFEIASSCCGPPPFVLRFPCSAHSSRREV